MPLHIIRQDITKLECDAIVNAAYNNGARGWDLFGAIAEGFLTGAVIGGIIGGLIAAFIYAAPTIGSFLGSSFQIGAYATAAGELVAVTVTGAQIAAAGLAALAGVGIMFSRTGKSNGYWGEKYSNDHDPEHFHLKGLMELILELESMVIR